MRRITFFVFISLTGVMGCSRSVPPTPTPQAPQVKAMRVVEQDYQASKRYLAQVNSVAQAQIRAQVSGILSAQLFEEGERVEQGQALFQIDPKLYRVRLALARAELEQARSALNFAELRVERAKQLRATQSLSQQELDERLLSLAQAQAQLRVAQAQTEQARIQLDYCTVRSPIDGVIGRAQVSVGALVSANQPQTLAEVVQLSPVWVDIQRPLTDQLKHDGNNAQIELHLGSHNAEYGQVVLVESLVNEGSNSVLTRARFENPQGRLLPGMRAEITLTAATAQATVLIPQSSVRMLPNGEARVFVVDGNSQTEIRIIELAEAIGNQWAVRSGLSEGDLLVLSGHQKLKAKTDVRVQLQESESLVLGGL
jgi:membrane fusion protein (multidrug efflux system)